MKKILSIALALTVLLSLAAVLAIPAAAVDGDWHILPKATFLQPDYDGDPESLAGYEYTDRGFHTIPTDAWKESNPYVFAQTKEKVDLKEGVYLEIEIDEFTYKNDKWFNLNIWDSVSLAPGNSDPIYGSGVQNLIRPSDSPDAEDLTKPGTVSGVSWYTGPFTAAGSSNMVAEKNLKTEDGDPIFCMSLTWDGTSYALDINGAAAPAAVITYMNEKWGGNDSEAYIGFWAKNSNKGGTVEYTITKFGTSAETATTPMGDDSEDPTNELIPPAPIADPNTVPANEPAIFLTADRENSDTKSKISASSGGYSTVNEDFSLHVIAENSTLSAVSYGVKNEVSYDIKDFPVAITLTRNFCTCGNEDGSCDALESSYYYIMAGDTLGATADWRTSVLDMSYNSYNIKNADGKNDTYLYFFCDFSEEYAEPMEGRINGIRFDVSGLDLNAENGGIFDVMFTAFFRTEEEAEAFVVQYLKDNYGLTDETTEETTEKVTETETDEATTAAPETDEVTTETPKTDDNATTEAPKTDDKKDEGGCASVIGFSAIAAVVAVAAAGVVTFRKKRD